MARYDASSAEILVFTFKEGLLSAVAHDLKLRATKFTLEVEGSTAKLELDAASLRVVVAMKDGQESPSSLSPAKYAEIEDNAAKDVLAVKKFPTITFAATTVTDTEVVGQLTLHGQTHEVRGKCSGNTAEFRLDQRQFGIKPFSAMLGTLKVKPEVTVRVSLRAA
jgi:polyisoprenoid-binding protein YceI